MKKKTRTAPAPAAQLDLGGAVTESASSAPSARAGRSSGASSRAARTASSGAVTVPSDSSALPRSKRKPGASELAFLREHRRVYRHPELYPDEALELSRIAIILGYRHPMTSVFAWPKPEAPVLKKGKRK